MSDRANYTRLKEYGTTKFEARVKQHSYALGRIHKKSREELALAGSVLFNLGGEYVVAFYQQPATCLADVV